MSEEKPIPEHPMTCGHMSTTDTCPYLCPDSKVVHVVVIDVDEDKSEPDSID